MDVHVWVLGSGTCFPEPDRVRRAHPGFFIKWGDESEQHLLLECSAGIAERLETIGIAPDEIQHLAISHAHPDHFALPHFVQSAHCATLARGYKSGEPPRELHLYCPNHIANTVEPLMAIHFEETVTTGQPSGLSTPVVRLHAMSNGHPEECCFTKLPDGSRLIGYPVYHGFGKVDALAFRLEIKDGPVIAYSGDSGDCAGLRQAARDTHLFICEASARIGDNASSRPGGYGHLNPGSASLIAGLVQAQWLLLTHDPGFDSEEAMLRDGANVFSGEKMVAEDGMHLVL